MNNNNSKKNTRRLVFLCLIAFFTIQSNAQFKGIIKNTTNRIIDGAANKAADALARKLAYEALKPVDKVFDDWVRESYEAEHGTEIDPEKQDSIFKSMGKNYSQFLAGLNKAVVLPSEFTLDLNMLIEIEDYNKDKTIVRMFYSKSEPIFAIRQQQDGKEQTILIHSKEDYMVMYTEDEKGKKTAQAIGGIFGMGAMMNQKNVNQNQFFSFEGPGKKKTFFKKFTAYEYKGQSDEYEYKYFFSTDLPINWDDSYGGILKRFSPNTYNQMSQEVNGMILEGETVKKENKKKSKWKTKEISEEAEVIINSEWKFEGIDAKK